MSTFKRARRPEQKQQRREAILAGAGRLARREGVRAVTLTDIADAVGIHKSALLRYFETREEIFLELTARAWRDWSAGLQAELDPVAGPASPALAASAMADCFASRPLLCDLIPHTALHLERNVSAEAVRRYKRTSLGAIADAAALIDSVLPGLDRAGAREFVAVMASLAGALWQVATPPPAIAALYASDPELAAACVELRPALARAGEVFLTGLYASSTST